MDLSDIGPHQENDYVESVECVRVESVRVGRVCRNLRSGRNINHRCSLCKENYHTRQKNRHCHCNNHLESYNFRLSGDKDMCLHLAHRSKSRLSTFSCYAVCSLLARPIQVFFDLFSWVSYATRITLMRPTAPIHLHCRCSNSYTVRGVSALILGSD